MGALLQRAWALDPTVVVDAARLLPAWSCWLLALLGLAFAGFGAGPHLLRATTAALAAAVGWLTAVRVVDPAATGLSPHLLSGAAAACLGILGGVWPVAAGVVIGGFALARLLAPWMPFGDPFLDALPGGLVGGALGGFFVRAAAALASAFVGAVAFALGLAGILLHHGWAPRLESHPVAALLPLGLIFVAGAAFQLTRRPKAPRPPPVAEPGGAT